MGIIGATRGLGRDEYNDVLGGIKLSVRPLVAWRTILQSINLLKVTNPQEVTGSNKHTQIPTQFLVPLNWNGNLKYEIFVVSQDDEKLLNKIEEGLRNPHYPPYLGVAYCPARIINVRKSKGQVIEQFNGDVYGAIQASSLDNGPRLKGTERVLRDRYPLSLDSTRQLKKADDLLIEEKGQSLQVDVRNVFFDGVHHHALI